MDVNCVYVAMDGLVVCASSSQFERDSAMCDPRRSGRTSYLFMPKREGEVPRLPAASPRHIYVCVSNQYERAGIISGTRITWNRRSPLCFAFR